jgi:hypothetical protein
MMHGLLFLRRKGEERISHDMLNMERAVDASIIIW